MQSRWWLPVITGIAGLAAGVFIGRDEAVAPPAPSISSAPAGVTTALTAEDIRRVVREELASKAAGIHAPPPVQPALTTTEQRAAAVQAQSVLDSAIARRSWTEADADALREIFDQMSADQQAEILRQYSLAVNQARLTPRTDRIPF
jgi:hypothetical protein